MLMKLELVQVLENNGGNRSKIRAGNTHSSYTADLGNQVTIDLDNSMELANFARYCWYWGY